MGGGRGTTKRLTTSAASRDSSLLQSKKGEDEEAGDTRVESAALEMVEIEEDVEGEDAANV